MASRPLTHERRVLLLALLAGLPGAVVAGVVLWSGDFSSRLRWTLGSLIVLAWWGFAAALRGSVVRPLQTLSNLLSALREEDFSFRFRARGRGDALSDVAQEVNALPRGRERTGLRPSRSPPLSQDPRPRERVPRRSGSVN